jgi:sulfur-oxidizing protein SoxY
MQKAQTRPPLTKGGQGGFALRHDGRESVKSPSIPLFQRGKMSVSRRSALRALAAGACVLVVRPAAATPESLALALRETFGDRPITPGRVKLELPRLAENGNVVPVTVSVDSPMTEQDYCERIYIFSELNPLPRVLEVQLGPHNGRARISSRIRVGTSQKMSAVAVMNDGSIWSATADIEVTVSGCGL